MAIKLIGLLPKPIHKTLDELESGVADDDDDLEQAYQAGTGHAPAKSTIPSYGKRKGWTPRNCEDFGDGGAFPDVPQLQYPRGMGKKGEQESRNKAVVPLQVGEDGKIKYDAILKQGAHKDRAMFGSYKDLVPTQIKEDDPLRDLPSEEAINETTEKTRTALDRLVEGQLVNTKATHVNLVDSKAQFIRYTPSLPGQAQAKTEQRIIRMVELQHDPMEPPKFKTNKKLPRGPPSPPAPVMHSPPRKVTAQEQNEWKIPPSISNWKNQKGFTIALDKRMAADGRGLQDTQVNENFAKLAEALYVAERKSREAIAMRQEVAKKASMKEKEKQEEELRLMAQRTREERAGIRPPKEAEVDEREEI
jgi:SNW domain-containing protein 1